MGSSRVDGSGTRSFRRITWGLRTCRSRQLEGVLGISATPVVDDGSCSMRRVSRYLAIPKTAVVEGPPELGKRQKTKQSAHAQGRCNNSSSRKCTRKEGPVPGRIQGAAVEVTKVSSWLAATTRRGTGQSWHVRGGGHRIPRGTRSAVMAGLGTSEGHGGGAGPLLQRSKTTGERATFGGGGARAHRSRGASGIMGRRLELGAEELERGTAAWWREEEKLGATLV
ncbi:hypothetical protein TRIUR3_29365 [Triticum urartu]|uniref:Uncharacterized protein n=1 Tax=Triticum urartu TaxID=4572 RepID=M8A2G3_TRIUA|nr:hypothetical protein TRIUR3_29365 [Triticum urartu]